MKILLFLACLFPLFGEEIDLSQYEHSIYSENGEDGIFAKLFQIAPPASPFCVEVGAYDGLTNSDTFLLGLQGWNRLLFDRQFEIPALHLQREFINAGNINQLFEKYNVPSDFALLCIDVDYNDFYVWKALDPKYRPLFVMIRYNGAHLPDQDKVIQYRPYYVGDHTDYFGASILALFRLGRTKGYSLIYAESSGRNLFFIRDEQLNDLGFKNINQVEKIYRIPKLEREKDYKQRPYLSSEELLK